MKQNEKHHSFITALTGIRISDIEKSELLYVKRKRFDRRRILHQFSYSWRVCIIQ